MKLKFGFTGVNIFDLLFVAFLSLKLARAVDWSWWIVFAPMIADFVLAAIAYWLAAREDYGKPPF